MAASTPMPGSTPDHVAHEDAKQRPQQVLPLQRHGKAVQYVVEQIHGLPQRNIGNCNCSAHENTTAPNTVIAMARMAADLMEFDVSPSADTNTSAKRRGQEAHEAAQDDEERDARRNAGHATDAIAARRLRQMLDEFSCTRRGPGWAESECPSATRKQLTIRGK